MALALVASLATAVAQAGVFDDKLPDLRQVAINGDRLSGFVLPVTPVNVDLTMSAVHAYTWQVDDTQRIQLHEDVLIRFGSYAFSTDAAEVWINRLPVRNADGSQGEVTQIALYFLRVSEPTRRAGFGATGKDLLVTASTRGNVVLRVAKRTEAMPPPSALLGNGQLRLSMHLRQLLAATEAGKMRMSPIPRYDEPQRPVDPPPIPGEPAVLPAPAPKPAGPAFMTLPENSNASNLPIVRPDGIVSFAAREIVIDEQANAITVEGGVEIDYTSDIAQGPQRLELRAERGVVFLAPDAIRALREGRREARAGDVLGVYLEGGVIGTDGTYMIRGSKVYYDFANNRAMIVDAVLRTYARLGRSVTLYARASEMRQLSANEFEANNAMVSTSEFFVPHLSIGADHVTITQAPEGLGEPTMIRAEGITLRAGKVPFFGLASFEGDTEPTPFRGAEAGYRSDLGAEIMTRWDLFQLFGMSAPEGVDGHLTVGGYTERGPAVGTKFTLSRGQTTGYLDLFGLYDLGGTDRTAAGLNVQKPDNQLRGIADTAFQTPLSSELNLQTQLEYISDETFISTFRRQDFSNRREYESAVYFDSIKENTALTLLTKYNFNGFLSNSYLLASRPYSVYKLPELGYRRYADNIWDDLLWTQAWSANMMALTPTKGTPNSLGIPVAAFGVASPTTNIRDAYEAAGYNDNYVTRLYTRHEFSLPFAQDNWNIAPFVHGSFAGYLFQDFNAYSPDAETMRFILGGGVRGSARYTRVDDTAENRLFDIHRIRHIIEPNGTLWYGYDNADPGTIPIYDQDIEGANGGAAAQVGLRQQWQTQRGGAGAWESVNFLTIDTGVVVNDSSDNFQPSDLTNPLHIAQSALPAFYTWRPELNQFGSNVYGMGAWQISDTFTLAGTGTYMLTDRQNVTNPDAILENLAKGSLGFEMRHTPDVNTYVEYRYIAPTQSDLIQFGILYQLGKKYLIAFSPQYDLRAGELRRIQGSLTRTFPDFNLNLTGGYDLIENQTTFSVNLRIPSDDAPVTWSGVPGSGTIR
ncbi:MAG: hypothetical protein U0572_04585 [Phycisphaerales bacterium]